MAGGSAGVSLVLTNGSYRGDVFNGSGYYNQTGNKLEEVLHWNGHDPYRRHLTDRDQAHR